MFGDTLSWNLLFYQWNFQGETALEKSQQKLFVAKIVQFQMLELYYRVLKGGVSKGKG